MSVRDFIKSSQPWDSAVAMWGIGSPIRVIQNGTIVIAAGSTSNTATITAVNPDNSILFLLGFHATGTINRAWNESGVRLAFTNSTTITASRNAISTLDSTPTVTFAVVEFVPGLIKSVQRNTVASGGTTAITGVNTARSLLTYLGFTSTDATINVNFVQLQGRVDFASATSVSGLVGSGTVTETIGFQVTEFY